MPNRVNYDEIAPVFDARYHGGLYDGVLEALRALVSAAESECALEVGCGTGYWLKALRPTVPNLYGVDYSLGMLRKARDRESGGKLVRATASLLPFGGAAFDLVFCVNALHHFEQIGEFIGEARRLLRPGGLLATIGMDPHHGRDCWCVYDHFPETRATDLRRYPSAGEIKDIMLGAGFDRVESRVACHFAQSRIGRSVLDDPELQRNGCSQMALLTDEQYAAGIERIIEALHNAEGSEPPIFKADITMLLQLGYVAS